MVPNAVSKKSVTEILQHVVLEVAAFVTCPLNCFLMKGANHSTGYFACAVDNKNRKNGPTTRTK